MKLVSLVPILLMAAFLSPLDLPCMAEEEVKELTVEEAKFQMVQLYSEAKPPQTKLRHKYPELRKADKLATTARGDYSSAVRKHPELKAKFEAIEQRKISIPEKMKLWAPLFQKAETLSSLDKIRARYNQARVAALKEEVNAIRAEGHVDLAEKMAAILSRIKS